MRPMVFTLPAPAMPETRVPKRSGAMIDLMRRRKIVPRIARPTACFGKTAPKAIPATRAIIIHVVREMRFIVSSRLKGRRRGRREREFFLLLLAFLLEPVDIESAQGQVR